MSKITKRHLFLSLGVEGPMHDPYGYSVYKVSTNLRSVEYKESGLGVDTLKITETSGVTRFSAYKPEEIKALREQFQALTGIPFAKFERYYFRAHPYYDDPIRCGF